MPAPPDLSLWDGGASAPDLPVPPGHPLLRLLMGEELALGDGSRYRALVEAEYDVLRVTVVHVGPDEAERSRRTWRLDAPSVALALDFADAAALDALDEPVTSGAFSHPLGG